MYRFKSTQEIVGAMVVAIAVLLGIWEKLLQSEHKYSSYSEYAQAPETVKAIERFFYGWLCFGVIVIICLAKRTENQVRARGHVPARARARVPAHSPGAAPANDPAAAPGLVAAHARLPAHDPAASPAVAAGPVFTDTPVPTHPASGSAPIPASASALAGPALTVDPDNARVRARIRAFARAIAPAGALDRSRAIARDRARASDASIDYVGTVDGVSYRRKTRG